MCFLTICDALWHTSQIEKTKDNREDSTDLVVDWINQSAFHVFHENRYLSIKYWSISLLFKGSFVQTEGLQPLGHPAHSRLYRRVRRAGREKLWENTLIFYQLTNFWERFWYFSCKCSTHNVGLEFGVRCSTSGDWQEKRLRMGDMRHAVIIFHKQCI